MTKTEPEEDTGEQNEFTRFFAMPGEKSTMEQEKRELLEKASEEIRGVKTGGHGPWAETYADLMSVPEGSYGFTVVTITGDTTVRTDPTQRSRSRVLRSTVNGSTETSYKGDARSVAAEEVLRNE
jgi:hypothetical protein